MDPEKKVWTAYFPYWIFVIPKSLVSLAIGQVRVCLKSIEKLGALKSTPTEMNEQWVLPQKFREHTRAGS